MSILERLTCETADLGQANVKKLLELFPECACEQGQVDFDKLRQVLSSEVIEGDVERYQFTWPGKRAAMAEANRKTNKTFRPIREDETTPTGIDSKGHPDCSSGSVNFDTTENLYIEGDNLEALKLLQSAYAGKVKMIYIDPPYNTGKDFVYRDYFSLNDDEIKAQNGILDDDGKMFAKYERNEEAEARYHTNWCNMMYPRLKLARELLSDDGVMFISIDDNEVTPLRKLCDEVFGEGNFVGQLILKTATDNNPSQINTEHEYMICFAKNKTIQEKWLRRSEAANKIIQKYEQLLHLFKTPQEIQKELRNWIKKHKEELPQISHYNNVDDKGVYSSSSNSSNPHPGGYMFDIIHPTTKLPCSKPANGWRWPEKTFADYEKEGEVEWGVDHTTQPHIKKRIETSVEFLRTLIYEDNRATTKMLSTLFDGKKVFDNPKPLKVLMRIFEFVLEKEAIILDFFSGSATTAHAVMQLNAEDGGKRKFILVQLPEVTDEKSEAYKAGYKNICEIGKERIRRAGKKIQEEHPLTTQQLDVGFRVLKIDASSINDVSKPVNEMSQEEMNFESERIKADRSSEDLLFQVLLQTQIPLSEKIERETICGNEVFTVGGVMVACLDKQAKLTEDFFTALAERQPAMAFFRDDTFVDDSARTNLEQIFKQFSKDTKIKVL